MNELTQNIQKMMVPKAAIIAYKYEDQSLIHISEPTRRS